MLTLKDIYNNLTWIVRRNMKQEIAVEVNDYLWLSITNFQLNRHTILTYCVSGNWYFLGIDLLKGSNLRKIS